MPPQATTFGRRNPIQIIRESGRVGASSRAVEVEMGGGVVSIVRNSGFSSENYLKPQLKHQAAGQTTEPNSNRTVEPCPVFLRS